MGAHYLYSFACIGLQLNELNNNNNNNDDIINDNDEKTPDDDINNDETMDDAANEELAEIMRNAGLDDDTEIANENEIMERSRDNNSVLAVPELQAAIWTQTDALLHLLKVFL